MKKISGFILIVVFVQLLGCNLNDLNPFIDKNIKEDHTLSLVYCKSCHQYPEADLLNKKTWALYVLPKMGNLLGFYHLETGSYIAGGKELIQLDQWKKIVQYYISQSPAAPLGRKKTAIKNGITNFTVIIPSFAVKKPVTTMVMIHPAMQKVFFGDGMNKQLYTLSKDYRLTDSFPVNEGISNLQFNSMGMMVLSMGVLHPSDENKGTLVVVDTVTKRAHVLLDSLQRPVHASYADLNQDGKEDIIICEFGNTTGALSWFENVDGTRYVKHILRALPGAIRTQVYDFNNDGRPDIIALMAQGDEGMFIYYNKGNGNFQEDRILQLPPSYGSNYFELADFNKDGHPDIVATNGDNGDYPPILKAYHGIRIYMNDGTNHFKEKLFLPVNGAGKVVARDFDNDGDLDLASIAYFPDFDHSPEEGFIYWENKGGFTFEPSSFKEVSAGRWLTMDAGDIDGDGDLDIVLGNTFFPLGHVPESLTRKWAQSAPSVLVLQNKLH